jgi:hypothetical protein
MRHLPPGGCPHGGVRLVHQNQEEEKNASAFFDCFSRIDYPRSTTPVRISPVEKLKQKPASGAWAYPVSAPCKQHRGTPIMETETLTIILGTVLPLYPILLVIHQRIGKYDEVVEEFKELRDEHEQKKEAYHGS